MSIFTSIRNLFSTVDSNAALRAEVDALRASNDAAIAALKENSDRVAKQNAMIAAARAVEDARAAAMASPAPVYANPVTIYRVTHRPATRSNWDKNCIISYAEHHCTDDLIPVYACLSADDAREWSFCAPGAAVWAVTVDASTVYVNTTAHEFDAMPYVEWIALDDDDRDHAHEVVAAAPLTGWVRV